MNLIFKSLVELQKKKSIEHSYIDINRVKIGPPVQQREEPRREMECSFTTKVKYFYTFQEVAFLMYKLSQMLRKREKSKPKQNVEEEKPREKPSFKQFQDGLQKLVRKKESYFGLEKITSLIDAQLSDARKKSVDNKRRWNLLRRKVTQFVSTPRNEEVESLRINVLKDLTVFLSKEARGFKNYLEPLSFRYIIFNSIYYFKDFKSCFHQPAVADYVMEGSFMCNFREKVSYR